MGREACPSRVEMPQFRRRQSLLRVTPLPANWARTPMSEHQADSHMPGRFPTTHWSRVVTAGRGGAVEAREALSDLCQAYWYPIYAYIRHRRCTPEQARDLTQDFFAY